MREKSIGIDDEMAEWNLISSMILAMRSWTLLCEGGAQEGLSRWPAIRMMSHAHYGVLMRVITNGSWLAKLLMEWSDLAFWRVKAQRQGAEAPGREKASEGYFVNNFMSFNILNGRFEERLIGRMIDALWWWWCFGDSALIGIYLSLRDGALKGKAWKFQMLRLKRFKRFQPSALLICCYEY